MTYLQHCGGIPAGPLVTGRRGGPITRATLSRELDRACRAAGVRRLTAHDIRRMGAATWAASMGARNGMFGFASSGRWAPIPPLTVAPSRRNLGLRAELPEPLSRSAVALCVYQHRPDVGQDVDTWVEGIDVESTSTAPVDIAARAGRYARAVGLRDEPHLRVTLQTVLRLALCWMYDDALSPAEREVFSVLMADGMATQEAMNAARLLA